MLQCGTLSGFVVGRYISHGRFELPYRACVRSRGVRVGAGHCNKYFMPFFLLYVLAGRLSLAIPFLVLCVRCCFGCGVRV